MEFDVAGCEPEHSTEKIQVFGLARKWSDIRFEGDPAIPDDQFRRADKHVARPAACFENGPARATRWAVRSSSSTGNFIREPDTPDEGVGEHPLFVRRDDNQRRLALNVYGIGLTDGSKRPGPQCLEEAVRHVGVGLVDLIQKNDAAVPWVGLRSTRGIGVLVLSAWRCADFQSKAHQSGPGRT